MKSVGNLTDGMGKVCGVSYDHASPEHVIV